MYKYEKVLGGGGEKISEYKDDTLHSLKHIPERKQTAIDGRRLTISVMDRSALMIFMDYPVLDTSLPYVNISYILCKYYMRNHFIKNYSV